MAPRETKTMLMQNFGMTNKQHLWCVMVFSVVVNTTTLTTSFPGFSPTRPYGARNRREPWERGATLIVACEQAQFGENQASQGKSLFLGTFFSCDGGSAAKNVPRTCMS